MTMMYDLWAMEENALNEFLHKTLNVTAEEEKSITSAFISGPAPLGYAVDGGTAVIKVEGVLRKKPASPILRFFGISVTSYLELIDVLGQVKDDPAIKDVRVIYDTPGGSVDGVDEAYQAMLDLATVKDVTAEVRGMLASAGYYLASPSSRIVSSAPTNEVGSIGVLVAYTSYKKMDERYGVKEIIITSKNAPNKAPDVDTKHGRGVVQERVDALERVFYKRISEGRGVSTEHIAKNFGQGGLLVSFDPDPEKPNAMSSGMIDKVLGLSPLKKKTKTLAMEEKQMSATLKTLMETDPGIKAEVEVIRKEAFENGEKSMREKTAKVTPFFVSDVYPKAIKVLAGKVLSGESEFAALEGAVTLFDAQEEQKKSDAAAVESAGASETPAQFDQTVVSKDGIITTQADVDAAVAADKKRHGLK